MSTILNLDLQYHPLAITPLCCRDIGVPHVPNLFTHGTAITSLVITPLHEKPARCMIKQRKNSNEVCPLSPGFGNRRHHRTLGNLPPRVINKSKHEIIITRGGFVRQNAGSTTVNTILPRAVALHTHKQYCIHIVYDMGVWCVNFPTPRFFAKPDNGRRGAG